jgi:hypothetical protein
MTDQQKLAELARLLEQLDEANGAAHHMGDVQEAISDFVADARKVLASGVVGLDGKTFPPNTPAPTD